MEELIRFARFHIKVKSYNILGDINEFFRKTNNHIFSVLQPVSELTALVNSLDNYVLDMVFGPYIYSC